MALLLGCCPNTARYAPSSWSAATLLPAVTLTSYRGVYPFNFPEAKPDFKGVDWQEDVDKRLKWGISSAIKLGVLNKGDAVVCVQGWRGGMGHTNTIRIVPAEEDLGLAGE